MMTVYSITIFQAEKKQKIRNVKIHDPSIIEIISGSKFFLWQNSTIELSKSHLLLCKSFSSLSFENTPNKKDRFISRMFSFHYSPYQSMIEQSKQNAQELKGLLILKDDILKVILNTLFIFEERCASEDIKRFWLLGLYQKLAEYGVLHYIFDNVTVTLSQRLSNYLGCNPSEEHTLLLSAKYFAMSRATMIRKLKQEGTRFSDILVDVRLNHALFLMQNGYDNISIIAQFCGYQSMKRFKLRFIKKFGLTPSDYINTILYKENEI